MKNSRTNGIPSISILAILAVGAGTLALGSCGFIDDVRNRISGTGTENQAGAEATTAAVITYLEGSVTVNGQAASIGDAVLSGDLLATGPDSLAELEFGDYRILRTDAESRLTLDSAAGVMTLDAGGLSVVQAKARRLGRRKPWLLETPTMVAAVRGTVYYARVEDDDDTYFCLCNGRITLRDPDEGRVLNLDAHHHDAVHFQRRDEGVVYTDGVMQYHSDDSMESLADAVHVPIDWTIIPD